MQKRTLGNLKVSAIGLGCMSMSFGYGPAGAQLPIGDGKCELAVGSWQKMGQGQS
jgi:aryl-alcohol dehydrogenase-like predicted oxidoreductase